MVCSCRAVQHKRRQDCCMDSRKPVHAAPVHVSGGLLDAWTSLRNGTLSQHAWSARARLLKQLPSSGKELQSA